jgi:hypothetical protein
MSAKKLKRAVLDFSSEKIKGLIDDGRKFWKVDIPFLTENMGEEEGIASYSPFFDRVEFHSKHLAVLEEQFPKLIDKEIEYAVMHELGHAKEARMYEENSFWPFTRIMAIPSNSGSRYEKEIKQIDHYFFNGIEDFKVEKKLFNCGYLRTKTIRFHRILPYIQSIMKTLAFPTADDMIDAYMNMPQTLCSYKFCEEISAEEKSIIEEYYVKVFGTHEIWKDFVTIIDNLEFGDTGKTINVVSKLLNDLFGYHVSVDSAKKEQIEQSIRKQFGFEDDFALPVLWTKNSYQIYRIQTTIDRKNLDL